VTRRSTDWILAFVGGLLLALMIHCNSLLAHHTTSVFASWVAHGLGAIAALALVALRPRTPAVSDAARPPLWFYAGGIPGAFTVILAAVAVNSSLTLSGAIAFMLVGQVVFGITSDQLGLLRTPRRRVATTDLLGALAVLAGSALIIFGGACA
jgi:transporter family-2 protein